MKSISNIADSLSTCSFIPAAFQADGAININEQHKKRALKLAGQVGLWAFLSLMEEVEASPKPGLVCPDHSGSHTDMDFSTFKASAKALQGYFRDTALIGYLLCHSEHSTTMQQLRRAGIKAEIAMLGATGGINTHKGAIFSMGLLSAAYGRIKALNKHYPKPIDLVEAVAAEAAKFIPNLIESELFPLRIALPQRELTAGERLFVRYGALGIRGEAQAAFPTAVEAYKVLEHSFALTGNFDLALPQTLLHIMTLLDDTNLLSRGGEKGLNYAKSTAQVALDLGGMFSPAGQAAVAQMHEEFPKRNLSPGGAADLLAVACFFRHMAIEH